MHTWGHSWPKEIPRTAASPHGCLGGERSALLRITACCRTCYLLTQPGLSQNYCFPNSSLSLHNSAYNCSCPKVIAALLTDHNQDYPFLLTVKTLHLAFYSLLSPLTCIMPFENPTWGFSTPVPRVTITSTLRSEGSDYSPGQHLPFRPCQASAQCGHSSLHQAFPHTASYSS